MRPSGYLFAALLLFSTVATAQRRVETNTFLLPEAQVEVALKGDDYLLASFNLASQTGPYSNTFSSGQLNFSYEHFWNERWSGGGLLAAYGYDNGYGEAQRLDYVVMPEAFVRHWNTLGSFNFRQRLGVAYSIPLVAGAQSRALTQLRLDLDRVFPLGEKLALRPRLSYEAAAYLRLQRDETQEKERVIDFGSLRAEVGVRLSPRVDFTPWVAYQTTYTNSIPQYDPLGNPTSGGRTNIVTPVVGLDVRLTLLRGEARPERRQLPTQH